MRLLPQVRILRQLQHPNILDVYLFYRNDPKYYYAVFEYIGGGEVLDHVVHKVGERYAAIPCSSALLICVVYIRKPSSRGVFGVQSTRRSPSAAKNITHSVVTYGSHFISSERQAL